MYKKLILISFAVLFIFFTQDAFAYDENTTHPALTQEVIDYYNFLNPQRQLTSEQKEWVILGSTLEDTAPRWVNHFYDPVHKTGWTGAGAGNIPAETARALATIALPTDRVLPSIEWIQNSSVQDKYSIYGGNWAWGKGLDNYASGDTKDAYIMLGHALHLLEDMAVPEHTRDDTHIDWNAIGDEGSPYEQYLTLVNRTNIADWNIIPILQSANAKPVEKSTVEDYFASLAKYSNHYFFSKDTINNPKYEFPKIVSEDGNFGYGVDENGVKFPLVLSDIKLGNGNAIIGTFSIKRREEYFPILNAYFSRLSRKAVLYGAGVVQLFQKQAADAVINKDFPAQIVKYDFSFMTPPSFSLLGELFKIYDGARLLIGLASRPTPRSPEAISTNVPEAVSDISNTDIFDSAIAQQEIITVVETTNESIQPQVQTAVNGSPQGPSPVFVAYGGASIQPTTLVQEAVQQTAETNVENPNNAATSTATSTEQTVENTTSTATSTPQETTSTTPVATSTEVVATSTATTTVIVATSSFHGIQLDSVQRKEDGHIQIKFTVLENLDRNVTIAGFIPIRTTDGALVLNSYLGQLQSLSKDTKPFNQRSYHDFFASNELCGTDYYWNDYAPNTQYTIDYPAFLTNYNIRAGDVIGLLYRYIPFHMTAPCMPPDGTETSGALAAYENFEPNLITITSPVNNVSILITDYVNAPYIVQYTEVDGGANESCFVEIDVSISDSFPVGYGTDHSQGIPCGVHVGTANFAKQTTSTLASGTWFLRARLLNAGGMTVATSSATQFTLVVPTPPPIVFNGIEFDTVARKQDGHTQIIFTVRSGLDRTKAIVSFVPVRVADGALVFNSYLGQIVSLVKGTRPIEWPGNSGQFAANQFCASDYKWEDYLENAQYTVDYPIAFTNSFINAGDGIGLIYNYVTYPCMNGTGSEASGVLINYTTE